MLNVKPWVFILNIEYIFMDMYSGYVTHAHLVEKWWCLKTSYFNLFQESFLLSGTNSLWPSEAIWQQEFENIGSCDGMLPKDPMDQWYRLVSNIRRTSNISRTPTLGNSQLEFSPTISLAKISNTRRTPSFDFWVSIVDRVRSRPTWSELLYFNPLIRIKGNQISIANVMVVIFVVGIPCLYVPSNL